MKISIVTVTYNSALYIADCIKSVYNQTYDDIEHIIIIDGDSKDETLEIINSIPNRVKIIISEPDKGKYDAMNKGIEVATGDVVGFLNSDDFFTSNHVIETIANVFKEHTNDAIYGDIHFVHLSYINRYNLSST